MKIIAAAVLMLLGSACALPTVAKDERMQERFIEGTIESAIDAIILLIQGAGLDPLTVDDWSGSFALEEEVLLIAEAHLKDLEFKGLSNLRIDQLSFSVLQMRLRMGLRMPSIYLGIGSTGFAVSSMGNDFSGSVSGSLEIVDLAISVDCRVAIGITGVVIIRSLSIVPSLGGIDSQLTILLNDMDYSETVNDVLGNRIPAFLAENSSTIQEAMVSFVIRIMESLF